LNLKKKMWDRHRNESKIIGHEAISRKGPGLEGGISPTERKNLKGTERNQRDSRKKNL